MATADIVEPDCSESIEVIFKDDHTFVIRRNTEEIVQSLDALVSSLTQISEDEGPCELKLTHQKITDRRGVVMNPISKELIDTTVHLEFLVGLDLSNIRMSIMELIFGNMPSLKSLMLNSTNIHSLHPSVGCLQNLESLSLRYNRLYDLPVTIRLLKNLTHLDVTGNLFRSLPGAVSHLTKLRTLVGLNDNLLELNAKWSEENFSIVSIPPLKKVTNLVTLDKVEKLSSIAIRQAVGLNIWLIPLPDQHRTEIAKTSITYDLCEFCLTPVKRITDTQETRGFLIKVCLVKFCGSKNVPFKFLACSSVCLEETIAKFVNLQKTLTDELALVDTDELTEVSLKDYRPIIIKQPSAVPDGKSKTGESKRKCTIS